MRREHAKGALHRLADTCSTRRRSTGASPSSCPRSSAAACTASASPPPALKSPARPANQDAGRFIRPLLEIHERLISTSLTSTDLDIENATLPAHELCASHGGERGGSVSSVATP